MSWINFPGFRGGPAAVVHGHVSFYSNVSVANFGGIFNDFFFLLINFRDLKSTVWQETTQLMKAAVILTKT